MNLSLQCFMFVSRASRRAKGKCSRLKAIHISNFHFSKGKSQTQMIAKVHTGKNVISIILKGVFGNVLQPGLDRPPREH